MVYVVAGSRRSVAEGLQMLGAEPEVDLVITDHAMPGMTGTELAAQIRQHWPELPIVLATGYSELPVDGEPGLPRLLKPHRQQELAQLGARMIEPVPRSRAAAVGAAAGH